MTLRIPDTEADLNDLYHRVRKSGVRWSVNYDEKTGSRYMSIRCVPSDLAGIGITVEQAGEWVEKVAVASPQA